MQSLLAEIEKHMQRHRQSPSRFGREAARDPRLVFDLRRGRGVGPQLHHRIETYLAGRAAKGEAK